MKNVYFLIFYFFFYVEVLKEFKSFVFLECEKGRSVYVGNIC